MMSGMEGMKMMKPTGDTDKDFAVMMKLHHQQALEMAKAEIAHGKSAELEALSRKIIAAPGRSQVFLTPSGGLTRSGRFGGAQNAMLSATRSERDSIGWKCLSATPSVGSPGRREV